MRRRAVSGGLNYRFVCVCVYVYVNSVHTICQWSWRFVLMCSDKQLRHAESLPYILYTHTNTLTQSHRYRSSSSWWRGHDPCGVIMSPVMIDHLRIKQAGGTQEGHKPPPLHMLPNKKYKKTTPQLHKHRKCWHLKFSVHVYARTDGA